MRPSTEAVKQWRTKIQQLETKLQSTRLVQLQEWAAHVEKNNSLTPKCVVWWKQEAFWDSWTQNIGVRVLDEKIIH